MWTGEADGGCYSPANCVNITVALPSYQRAQSEPGAGVRRQTVKRRLQSPQGSKSADRDPHSQFADIVAGWPDLEASRSPQHRGTDVPQPKTYRLSSDFSD